MYQQFWLLGVYLGVIYEVVNFVRKIVANRTFTLVVDILAMLSFGITVFLYFTAYTNGNIRALLLLLTIFGFILVKLSLGLILDFIYRKIYQKIYTYMKNLLVKILKKVKNFSKNLLKIYHRILYNRVIKNKKEEVVTNEPNKKSKKQDKTT